MRYLQYTDAGEILCLGSAPDGCDVSHMGLVILDPPENVSALTHYVDAGECVPLPAKPSQHHNWDWATKAWLPMLAEAQAARKAVVDKEFVRRTFAPILYDGAPFDADERVSRPRITGLHQRLMRGDPLPLDWIGWRDANNEYHWPTATPAEVQAHLAGLSRAIEDREQSLLIAAWQHKAAIDALTTVDDVIAYDMTGGL